MTDVPDTAADPLERPLRRTALIAAVATLLLRLPLVARRMWDHDSIQFALGVERFDLAAHHPHPPGYPLYIALLKALDAVGIEPLAAMVALSVLASALGAAACVLLAGRLTAAARASRPTAVDEACAAAAFAGLLYAVDPLLWFYGELPLVYAVEGGLAPALAYLLYRARDRRASFYAAAALAGLTAGIRPSTVVLLAPLIAAGALAAWRRGARETARGRRPAVGGRQLILGALLGTAVVLAWLVPFLAAVGGIAEYRRLSGEHFGALLPVTSVLYGAGWGALAHNLASLVKWAIQGTVHALAALALLAGLAPGELGDGVGRLLAVCDQDRSGGPGSDGRPTRWLDRLLPASAAGWLTVWALPPVLFFALFHITKAGYTLIHLPALLIGLALIAAPALAAHRRAHHVAWATALLLGAAVFLASGPRQAGEGRLLFPLRHKHTAGEIARYEEELDEALAIIRRHSATTTALITVELSGQGGAGAAGFLYPWQRHLQWYCPAYLTVLLVPEQPAAQATRGALRDDPGYEADLASLPLDRWRHRPFQRLPLGPDRRLRLPEGIDTLLVVTARDPGDRFTVRGRELMTGGSFHIERLALPEEGLELGGIEIVSRGERSAAFSG